MLTTKMTCPQCGLQPLADQKYCRACGANLQVTTQPLTAPASISNLKKTSAATSKDEEQGNRFVLWGLMIILIGVAIGVLGKKLIHEDIVTVVGVLVSLAGMFLTAYAYLSPAHPQKKHSSSTSRPEVLIPSPPKDHLPPGSNIEWVPSITERTTNLLEDSVATKHRQKEDGET